MVPRWSRLALAAILAFGASPGLAAAAAAERGCPAACCGDLEDAAAPSLIAAVVVDAFPRSHGVRHAPPLCAPAPAAPTVARSVVVERVPARPTDDGPGPRRAAWRLAPKTSPPAR